MSNAGNIQCLVNGDTSGKQISVRVNPGGGVVPSCVCDLIHPPFCQYGHVATRNWGPDNRCWQKAFLACEKNYLVAGPARGGRHFFTPDMFRVTKRMSGFGQGDGPCVVVTIKDDPPMTGGDGGYSRSSRSRALSSGPNHESGSKVGSMFSGGRSRRGSMTTRLLEAGSLRGDGDLVSTSRAAGSRDAGGSKAETIRASSRMSQALSSRHGGNSRSASQAPGGGSRISGADGEIRIGSRTSRAMSVTGSRNDVLSRSGSRVQSMSGSRARTDSRDDPVSQILGSRMSHLSVSGSHRDRSRLGDDARSRTSGVAGSRSRSSRITGPIIEIDEYDDDMAETGGLVGMRGSRRF